VTYTSPYYSPGDGGVLAIPEVGSRILVYLDSKTGEMFYLSTILADDPDNPKSGGRVLWKSIPNDRLFSQDNKPQGLTFQNKFGDGLEVKRVLGKNKNFDSSTSLKQGSKRVTLSDNPASDRIVIDNGHGDGITITSESVAGSMAAKNILVKSAGSSEVRSTYGDVTLAVCQGGDINLHNTTIPGIMLPGGGNINLKSDWSTISLVCDGPEAGAITIKTAKGIFQINEAGFVTIEGLNINIKSTGILNLVGTAINLDSEIVNIKSSTTVNIDGPAGVYLNSNTTPPEIPIVPSTPINPLSRINIL
jgi:hypothetical protein